MTVQASPEAQQAVAAFAAAGNDPDALSAAIDQAKFLDNVPGEERQKLRAARTKLKKLRLDDEKKKVAASAKSAADRSPHTKESYDDKEYEQLAEKYQKLNWRIISKPGGATVKPDEFYSLYGLQMQAEKGENTTERPMWAEKGGLDFEGRAKWDAWTSYKGMATAKARLQLVKEYYEFPVKALYSDTRP
ncbi:hypothetical protein WJX84_001796 [Apatococcus fuscideae]|uniref:ACB domain-containing protein n=1 Tax=Apatococcus fuscideae TaxID=2026836 RepID=A0AAW1T3H9_9CHLO